MVLGHNQHKKCTWCNKTLTLLYFYKTKYTKIGFTSWCKQCIRKAVRDHRLKFPKRKKESTARWYRKNKSKVRRKYLLWAINNKHRIRVIQKRYRLKHPDRLKLTRKKWAKTHRNYIRATRKAYAHRVKMQQPRWVNKEALRSIYLNCPKGYHVDHIIPLKGKNVSGLHVPWNLQYLTPKQNQRKSNKLLVA